MIVHVTQKNYLFRAILKGQSILSVDIGLENISTIFALVSSHNMSLQGWMAWIKREMIKALLQLF